MTPWEQTGWKATDKLRVKRNTPTARVGDVLTLQRDDDTTCPYFNGSSLYPCASIELSNLELIPEDILTGGSSAYYSVVVSKPTDPNKEKYSAECNDIIEALNMTFAEGNAFKAIWRTAAARQGNGKPGHTAKYDAEKVVFFGQRMLAQAKGE